MLGIVLTSLSACASIPRPVVAPGPPAPVPPSLDTRVAWMLRLEQQRVLREAPGAESAPPEVVSGFRPAMSPDLAALLNDSEEAVRARTAIAIGRVGMTEGGTLLQTALADPAETVRANAAFGLGLLASRTAVPVLHAALADPAIAVRLRAVEALGLIGDPASGAAIAQAASGCRAVLAAVGADDEEWPKAPEVELCRLSLYALVRLQDFNALAQIALDDSGQPVSNWWPVAYALQRSGDRRAIPALRTLASSSAVYTAGFAVRGLASHQDAQMVSHARALVSNRNLDTKVRIAAMRLLAGAGGGADVAALTGVLSQEPSSSSLALEAVAALGTLRAVESFDTLVDAFSDPAPGMRAAALVAAARVDPDTFLLVLSGITRDRDWSVRAALATVLGTLPAERVTPALVDLTADEDARVHSAALRALAVIKVPDLADRLAIALAAEDFAARATAAELIGQLRPEGGVDRLSMAYTRGGSDSTYVARMAAIEAIADYGPAGAETLRLALSDREWPVRMRAAALLRAMGVTEAEPDRPAPLRHPASFFESEAILHPAYSPRAFIETRRGVIELQLDLVDAPLTVATFIEQVRGGLFNGLRVHRLVPAFVIQAGDPRGDGVGGPGYTQRDEFSATPFLRGTVGMATGGAETAGSQWFITTSPQPHLDARYTAFGRVVNGWELLDQVAVGDVVERVRIWDGIELR